MRRREFITFIGGALVGWPLTARAQQGGPVRLIGVLMAQVESNSAAQSWLAAFRDELAKLGWKEGSNLRIELRWSTDNAEALRKLAKELVDLRPDAILGRGTSETIGFTASLARPGGNITGFTNVESTLGGKWVELLKEIAPHTVRVSLLFNPKTVAPLQFYLPSIQTAAKSLAVQVSTAPVHAKEEIEGVMAALARDPGGGLIAMPDTFTGANLGLIIALAARYRVPAISYAPLYAESDGLIAYGVNFVGLFRQAAGYIDRILKGAKPADLPVQLPAKLEMVINLKTAKALGLNIQDSFLLRADKVIE
jgi:putative ABC transport system substrate-binding protein